MATILVKRGTTDKIAAYTGTCGELVFDTEAKNLYVMDGETIGGTKVGNDVGDVDGGVLEEPVSTTPTLTIIVEGNKNVESLVVSSHYYFQVNKSDGSVVSEFKVGSTTFSYDELNLDNPIQFDYTFEPDPMSVIGIYMSEADLAKSYNYSSGSGYIDIDSLNNITRSKAKAGAPTGSDNLSNLYIVDETQSSSLTITMV